MGVTAGRMLEGQLSGTTCELRLAAAELPIEQEQRLALLTNVSQ